MVLNSTFFKNMWSGPTGFKIIKFVNVFAESDFDVVKMSCFCAEKWKLDNKNPKRLNAKIGRKKQSNDSNTFWIWRSLLNIYRNIYRFCMLLLLLVLCLLSETIRIQLQQHKHHINNISFSGGSFPFSSQDKSLYWNQRVQGRHVRPSDIVKIHLDPTSRSAIGFGSFHLAIDGWSVWISGKVCSTKKA